MSGLLWFGWGWADWVTWCVIMFAVGYARGYVVDRYRRSRERKR